MPVHTITEAQIRAIAPSTYERGWEYYYDDAVIDVIQRGADLVAQVQGSDYEPYRVHVRLGADGVESWECSCPYDWGGACKHVAAVLLTYLHRADQIEARPPLQDLLGNLDAEDLRQVIVHLVARQPALASEVEQAVQSLTTLQAATPEQGAALSLLDQDRLEMLLSSTTPQPEALARMFAPYVEAGQGAALLQALARITEHYVHRWLADEGYYDEAGDYLYVLDDYWATALLCVDLPAGERRRWADRLRRWQEQVEDYGFDDLFVTAHTAAKEGWDDPQITRALRGDLSTGAALYDELPDYDPDLIDIRLQILEHREQTEEYLNLAQASGAWQAYATMLAKLGRADEATAVALQRLATHAEALQVAQALYDSNAVEQALQIAEHGLTLHGTSQIERWIKVGGIAFQAQALWAKRR